MNMVEKDSGIDTFFESARKTAPAFSRDLNSRILSDAQSVQAGFSRVARLDNRPTGILRQLSDILGGWYGWGGLATACATGIWLGFAPPAGLPDLTGLTVQSDATADLFESQGLLLALAEDS